MEIYEMEFGARLRDARLKAGLARQELSDRLFVSPRSVKSWEEGTRLPRLYTVCELAKILNVSAGYLVAGEE